MDGEDRGGRERRNCQKPHFPQSRASGAERRKRPSCEHSILLRVIGDRPRVFPWVLTGLRALNLVPPPLSPCAVSEVPLLLCALGSTWAKRKENFRELLRAKEASPGRGAVLPRRLSSHICATCHPKSLRGPRWGESCHLSGCPFPTSKGDHRRLSTALLFLTNDRVLTNK